MVNAVLNRERKAKMLERTKECFSTYKNYMVLSIDKVQSTQFKDIVSELPPNFRFLFAKNKILKKVLRDIGEKKYEKLINSIKGNVLIAFFDGADPRDMLTASLRHQRAARALPGILSNKDVVIPAGPTGLPPEKINVFQSAGINTKIVKGKIDLASDHKLVSKGEVLDIAKANLLDMLGILPFEFGLQILRIFESGEVYEQDVLLIDESCIEELIKEATSSVAAVSLGLGITTDASLPYEISHVYEDLQRVAFGLEVSLRN